MSLRAADALEMYDCIPLVISRAASKSNFLDPGDHRESPLHAFVGAGLQVCVPARKSSNWGDFDAFLDNQPTLLDNQPTLLEI